MAKPKLRPRRDAPVPFPYHEAPDPPLQQIMQCGLIGCHPHDHEEWFDNTMEYLSGRYPEIKAPEIAELRTLGERFAQPTRKQAQEAAAV